MSRRVTSEFKMTSRARVAPDPAYARNCSGAVRSACSPAISIPAKRFSATTSTRRCVRRLSDDSEGDGRSGSAHRTALTLASVRRAVHSDPSVGIVWITSLSSTKQATTTNDRTRTSGCACVLWGDVATHRRAVTFRHALSESSKWRPSMR